MLSTVLSHKGPLDLIPRYRVYAEGVSLKIGEVVERGGVNLQTIRYYEREGLLPEPPRLASGYRMFPKQPCAGAVKSESHRF